MKKISKILFVLLMFFLIAGCKKNKETNTSKKAQTEESIRSSEKAGTTTLKNSKSTSTISTSKSTKTTSKVTSTEEIIPTHEHVLDFKGECTVDGCEYSLLNNVTGAEENNFKDTTLNVKDGKVYIHLFDFDNLRNYTVSVSLNFNDDSNHKIFENSDSFFENIKFYDALGLELEAFKPYNDVLQKVQITSINNCNDCYIVIELKNHFIETINLSYGCSGEYAILSLNSCECIPNEIVCERQYYITQSYNIIDGKLYLHVKQKDNIPGTLHVAIRYYRYDGKIKEEDPTAFENLLVYDSAFNPLDATYSISEIESEEEQFQNWSFDEKEKEFYIVITFIDDSIDAAKMTYSYLLYNPNPCNIFDILFLAEEIGIEYKVKEIFKKARNAGRSIIFFDEFDSMASKRDSDGSSVDGEMARFVASFLTKVDGFKKPKGCEMLLLMAATNRPWAIDPAMLRGGRFDTHIYVGMPDQEARKFLVEKEFKDLTLSGFTTDELASDLIDFAGADIVAICRKIKQIAYRRAIKNNSFEPITREDARQVIENTQISVSIDQIDRFIDFKEGKFN